MLEHHDFGHNDIPESFLDLFSDWIEVAFDCWSTLGYQGFDDDFQDRTSSLVSAWCRGCISWSMPLPMTNL